ncbi:hypothetical protein H920_17759 [Fukomys damarensis]|uniref:Uncharacterized protein n=1 Tax=Fukomys damarensis TaxID=885580 RepID=A0A091DDS0_FUKDA|nr:hypothetical protein H920_17759 [Fukomys damarensis]
MQVLEIVDANWQQDASGHPKKSIVKLQINPGWQKAAGCRSTNTQQLCYSAWTTIVCGILAHIVRKTSLLIVRSTCCHINNTKKVDTSAWQRVCRRTLSQPADTIWLDLVHVLGDFPEQPTGEEKRLPPQQGNSVM